MDRIVVRIRYQRLSKKLMFHKTFTLDECINIVHQEEEVDKQQGVMRGKIETAVNYVS